MGIGTGIALFVIGAILAFAISIPLGGVVNLALIGYILMGAGVVVFIISLVFSLRNKQSTTTVRESVDPASGQAVSQRSTSTTPDPNGPVV